MEPWMIGVTGMYIVALSWSIRQRLQDAQDEAAANLKEVEHLQEKLAADNLTLRDKLDRDPFKRLRALSDVTPYPDYEPFELERLDPRQLEPPETFCPDCGTSYIKSDGARYVRNCGCKGKYPVEYAAAVLELKVALGVPDNQSVFDVSDIVGRPE